MAKDLFPGFLSGELKPIIDQTFNMSDAKLALSYMQDNLNIGKIVLISDL